MGLMVILAMGCSLQFLRCDGAWWGGLIERVQVISGSVVGGSYLMEVCGVGWGKVDEGDMRERGLW